jgi:hypothetical protein
VDTEELDLDEDESYVIDPDTGFEFDEFYDFDENVTDADGAVCFPERIQLPQF